MYGVLGAAPFGCGAPQWVVGAGDPVSRPEAGAWHLWGKGKSAAPKTRHNDEDAALHESWLDSASTASSAVSGRNGRAIGLRPSNDFYCGARQGQLTRQHRAKKGCPKQAAMGTADPPAAVVQRLQEEHLRKDVIGYGSLGEACWQRRAAAPGRHQGI